VRFVFVSRLSAEFHFRPTGRKEKNRWASMKEDTGWACIECVENLPGALPGIEVRTTGLLLRHLLIEPATATATIY
jgi:hypothetical protein